MAGLIVVVSLALILLSVAQIVRAELRLARTERVRAARESARVMGEYHGPRPKRAVSPAKTTVSLPAMTEQEIQEEYQTLVTQCTVIVHNPFARAR